MSYGICSKSESEGKDCRDSGVLGWDRSLDRIMGEEDVLEGVLGYY